MDELVNGWMDLWMDGWMDELVNGWMDRWKDGWMNGWIDMDKHPPDTVTQNLQRDCSLNSTTNYLFNLQKEITYNNPNSSKMPQKKHLTPYKQKYQFPRLFLRNSLLEKRKRRNAELGPANTIIRNRSKQVTIFQDEEEHIRAKR